jgi:hypothetical protein
MKYLYIHNFLHVLVGHAAILREKTRSIKIKDDTVIEATEPIQDIK